MPPVLEFRSVSKCYRGLFASPPVEALKDFSLAVKPGEIFGFLGPNGAGKSTAIHIALALLRPSSGAGRMLGQPFGNAVARRRVGFLAENVALYHRPVKKLLSFYGALNRIPDRELAKRVKDVLDVLELSEHADRNAGKLSRGMLQRVGLAQALINDPDLVILDEPTSALDPVARAAVREMLLTMKARGKTIFLSSHMLSEVEAVSDRVAILVQGRVVRMGKTADLLERRDEVQIVARNAPALQTNAQTLNRDGLVELRVPASAQRQAIEQIWAQGGELMSVNPVRKSLEQLFLELASLEKKDPRS
ncbi:MAG: ABC transporter ATP-binding protein [Acidobacteriales bacterium]|nr:ABC transporter ATP-binding protein [Terriglobales bacterium]